MKIILEGDEAQAYVGQKIGEAILEQTTRFPANMKPPEGCKWRPKPLSKEHKALILELHESGMGRAQIARELGLPGRQVSGVIQAYINSKKGVYMTPPHVIDYIETAKIEGLQPMKPLIMPETKKPAIEATGTSCGKPLTRDKVAIDGKMYCGQGCAPKKVPTMITKRPKAPKSNSAIDSLIIDVSAKNQDPLDIANEINRVFGGTWMPGDVTRRLKELRT
ncbi:hypothetical protein M0R72_12365 [Candidatus Pacearchaeota archaeon]|jgi:hypothetical protein|nr:hypothetical protein [Candidatus Pacearchaeota archaeon]